MCITNQLIVNFMTKETTFPLIKVADFGLAKLSSDTYTHVSTRVMGTFG